MRVLVAPELVKIGVNNVVVSPGLLCVVFSEHFAWCSVEEPVCNRVPRNETISRPFQAIYVHLRLVVVRGECHAWLNS